MCKHCGHAYGDHWQNDNKCAVKGCQCPGYEKSDEEKAKRRKELTNWLWSMTAAVLTSPLFFLFSSVGGSGTGRAAWLSAMMILLAMRVRWELKRHSWFWLTMACIAFAHLALILMVSWSSRWIPAVALLPIAIADFAVILGCLHLMEKWANPSGVSKQPEPAGQTEVADR